MQSTVSSRQSQNQTPELAMPVWCLNSLVCAPPPWRGSIGPTREDRLNFFYFAFLLPNHFSIQTFQFQTIMSPMNSVAVDVTLVMGLWIGKMFNTTVKIFHGSGIRVEVMISCI